VLARCPTLPQVRCEGFSRRRMPRPGIYRAIAKVEWHRGELFSRVGFIVTSFSWRSNRVVRFYNARSTADQRNKEGKNAVKWMKFSGRTFKDRPAFSKS
jgi:hypothetical protein